ncbi:MAG: penicillin acylase family protein [Pirellulales bacterium]|nr:penicillin acylase family protein [Pirellulales bacterium]
MNAATLALVCACHLVGANSGEQVTVYRDDWGVPHIYADTPAGGAFGLGYAQAEDRLEDIYFAVRTGLGRMAEAYGPDWVDQDYIMRLCRNEEVMREAWPKCPPELVQFARAFHAGIEAYIAEHPDRVPKSALPLEPWMFGTVGRAMILRWPLGTIQDDLENREREHVLMRSNEWSVSPARTADHRAILLADPHMTWDGLAVLYEARVHAGDLHMCGFFLIGTPIMGYGHNQHVGWANTTGGPDTADVYKLTVRKKPGLIPVYEYLYDGQWRPMKLVFNRIEVKDSKPVGRPALYTHLGPLVSAPEGDVAYAAACPYFDATRLFEQFYKMNLAKNSQEIYDALAMLEYNEQNVMFADTQGTIAYVRNGRTPIRPDGYDWNAPVPGDSSATAWKGIHPLADLVQIFNPPTGYMQNCNISPAAMMHDSPLVRDKYPPYIFNVYSWEQGPRGLRATQLLREDGKVTEDAALRYATDVYDLLAQAWQQALRDALGVPGLERPDAPEFAAATQAILSWDGQFTPEAQQTVLLKSWREKLEHREEFAPLAKKQPLSSEAQRELVKTLAQAWDEVRQRYGRWDVAWGEVYRLGRGGQFAPAPGTDFGDRKDEYNYSETLFDVESKPDASDDKRYLAYNGTCSPILMFFGPDGVESYSCVMWGQSGDPESPHYMDQGRELYSKRKLKPTYWRKEDLLQHVASQHTFTLPDISDETAPTDKGQPAAR